MAGAWGGPNLVYRTMFGVAAMMTTRSILEVAYVEEPIAVVVLLSATLFFRAGVACTGRSRRCWRAVIGPAFSVAA